MAPRLRQVGSIAAVLAALLLAPAAGAAESVHFFKDPCFDIPVKGVSGHYKQATLYVSTDGQRFQVAGTVPPDKDSFSYTAPADGWYFFVLQLEDQEGRKTPDPITPDDVGLKVCVDRKKPEVTLRPTLPQEGTVAVVWTVKEDGAVESIVLEYSPKGRQEWQNVPIKPLKHAQRSWAATGAGPFDVRLTVKDRAGNVATATTVVSAKAGAGAGGAAGGPRAERHVPSKTFNLNYKVDKVGRSGMKNVEIWWTEDTRTWQVLKVLKPDAALEGTVLITVPAERAYGFTVRPVNGVGRGPEAPRPFQEPQIWIRVDETKPKVTLRSVVVQEGADPMLAITWQALDDHLGDRPIALYFSQDGQDWKLLKGGLENTGSYTHPTKDLPFEFHVRVEATDRAGNKNSDKTQEPVKVDNSIPEVKDIGVSVDAKREGAPATPASTAGAAALPPAGGPPGVPPPLPGG